MDLLITQGMWDASLHISLLLLNRRRIWWQNLQSSLPNTAPDAGGADQRLSKIAEQVFQTQRQAPAPPHANSIVELSRKTLNQFEQELLQV